jgi:hypothetical protein
VFILSNGANIVPGAQFTVEMKVFRPIALITGRAIYGRNEDISPDCAYARHR